MNYTCCIETPIGTAYALSDGEAITGLRYVKGAYMGAEEKSSLPVFKKLRLWLAEYFEGKAPEIDFPLLSEGTAYRLRVWNELRKIPYGKTVSYGSIAKTLGSSARAVGGAVGANPISILVPCHRVIGANGALTGFGEGIERKKFLLGLEGSL